MVLLPFGVVYTVYTTYVSYWSYWGWFIGGFDEILVIAGPKLTQRLQSRVLSERPIKICKSLTWSKPFAVCVRTGGLRSTFGLYHQRHLALDHKFTRSLNLCSQCFSNTLGSKELFGHLWPWCDPNGATLLEARGSKWRLCASWCSWCTHLLCAQSLRHLSLIHGGRAWLWIGSHWYSKMIMAFSNWRSQYKLWKDRKVFEFVESLVPAPKRIFKYCFESVPHLYPHPELSRN